MLLCYNLANMYDTQDGVTKDPFKAVEYLIKACDLNHPKVCYNLAYKYKMKMVLKKILSKSCTIYEKGLWI